jgi:hypothetical protein
VSCSSQKDPHIVLYGYHFYTFASKDRKDSCAIVLGTEIWIWHTTLLAAKSLPHVTQGIEVYGLKFIFITYLFNNALRFRTGTATLITDVQ